MSRILGLVLAGGLLLGSASNAEAQFGLSIGNPYTGQGITIGNTGYGAYSPYGYNSNYGYNNNLYGYNSAYSGYGYNSGYSGYGYNSGYSGYSYPSYGGYGYSSGYSGYTPSYGYSTYAAPVYSTYSSYRYPAYGYGYRRNVGIPFVGRFFR